MLEAQALSIHVAGANSLYDRPDFLASLEAQTDPAYQVVFIDLGAGKASTSEFEVTRPDVVKLRTFRNIGLVRAHNQAIAMALSRWPREVWAERYVVLTCPETAFDRRACESIQQAFREDPTLMVAGPKVFWADSRAQTDGDWVELVHTDELYAAGIGLTRGRTLRYLGQGSQDAGQVDLGNGVLLLSEACVVIRASFLERLLLAEQVWLDPRLPFRFSVFDLCARATRAGSRPQLLPEARVWFAPKDQSRQKKRLWRELYVPSTFRSELDDVALRCIHAPWVVWSFLRYRFSRFFFAKFWKERFTLELGAVEGASNLKFRRPPDRAVPLADRRRWFIS